MKIKTSYIIAIVALLIGVFIIVYTAGDASTYANFDDALTLEKNGSEKEIHIVGELKKDAAGNVQGIEPSLDKVSFSFWMKDEKNHEEQVFYPEPMPPDFTKSEKIVVIGHYKNHQFFASKILLKCPSKYQEKPKNT